MKVFLVLLVGFTLLFCAPSKKFVKLSSKIENQSNLYLLRTTNPTYLLFSFNIEVYKYKDHFKKESEPTKIADINLDANEFSFLPLTEGYYQLKVSNQEDTSKILFLKNQNEHFINLSIVSKGGFSRAELYFHTMDKETALRELLNWERMVEQVPKFYD